MSFDTIFNLFSKTNVTDEELISSYLVRLFENLIQSLI